MRLDLSMKRLIARMVFSAVFAAGGALFAGQVLAAAPAPAAAQPASKPGKAPIDITADRLDTQNTDCIYTWTGSPEALQDTSRLRADVMIAHMEIVRNANKGAPPKPVVEPTAAPGASSSNSCGDVKTLEAKGHVYYVSVDGKRVHGDNAFYDAASTTITITGDVTAVQGQNVMRGTKMVDNTQTGEGYVVGGAKGAGAKNRPRAVLYPKDKDNNGDQNAQAPAGQANGQATATDAAPKPKKKKKSSN